MQDEIVFFAYYLLHLLLKNNCQNILTISVFDATAEKSVKVKEKFLILKNTDDVSLNLVFDFCVCISFYIVH